MLGAASLREAQNILLCGLAISLLSCEKKIVEEKPSVKVISMARAKSDVDLPVSLWDILEKADSVPDLSKKLDAPPLRKKTMEEALQAKPESPHGAPTEHGAAPAGEHGAAPAGEHGAAPAGEHGAAPAGEHGGGGGGGLKVDGDKPIDYWPVTVTLVATTKNSLSEGNVELRLNKGGGEIDLKDFISESPGTFRFQVQVGKDLSTSDYRVFFLSNSKLRKASGDLYGSGCQKYYEITRYFRQEMSRDGFLVSTMAGRHASSLGGTYFFVGQNEGKTFLAQLTVKDGRFRQYHCRR